MSELKLNVAVESFSYRGGIKPSPSAHGGGFIFDCRAIRNPGREAQYAPQTGRDRGVCEYLESDPDVTQYRSTVFSLIDLSVQRYLDKGYTDLEVRFGCTGGRHRSVYFAEQLAAHLRTNPRVNVTLRHTGLEALGL